MVKVEVRLAENCLHYEGSLEYYNNSHKTKVYWECKNPGSRTPGLSFFTKDKKQDGNQLIVSVDDVDLFIKDIVSKKETNQFHITLFNQRKIIFNEISIFLKKERRGRYANPILE